MLVMGGNERSPNDSLYYGGGSPSRGPFFAPYRPQTEDVYPEEDIDMKMRARIINDILKGKLHPEELRNLPQFNPRNELPNMNWFTPYT